MQTVDIDALLDRHRDRFRKLVQTILSEETGEDPFRFPLARFKALSDDEKAEIVRRADLIARDRVDHELEARGDRCVAAECHVRPVLVVVRRGGGDAHRGR
jgi:hypothetical protein